MYKITGSFPRRRSLAGFPGCIRGRGSLSGHVGESGPGPGRRVTPVSTEITKGTVGLHQMLDTIKRLLYNSGKEV